MASQWFIRSSSKTHGPFSSSDLKRFAESGKIKPETRVASSQEGPWHPAANVRGLFPALQQPAATSTGSAQARRLSPDVASLRQLCEAVDAPDFFVSSDLKQKQIAKICQAFGIPSPGLLVAILDGSTFKSGTRGLAICADGIRWKNGFSVDTTKSYLTWDELRSLEPQLTSQKHVDFGNAMVADLSDTRFPLLDVMPFLKALTAPQHFVHGKPSRPPHSPRRPRSLRFAYKEAIGATFVSMVLCILAVGFVGGFFLAVFKKMDQSRFGSAEKASVEVAESPRPAQSALQSVASSRARNVLTFEQAELAVKQKGNLNLSTFTHMTDEAAEVLSQHKGILNLDGLAELSDGQAKALARHDGELDLAGLTVISDEAAESLASHKDFLMLGVKVLSEKQTEILATHKGGLLCFERLETISDAIAESLAKHSRHLDLDGLTTLSDKQAEWLGSHRGGHLYLNGLSVLSDKQAQSLAKYRGGLSLKGLTTISNSQAESFGNHSGDELRLNGIGILSDEQARSLSRHRGRLELQGLSTLSERAESLLRSNARFMLPEGPLSAAAAGAPAASPAPRQASKQSPKPEPKVPEYKIKRQRFIRSLVGRWAGVWTNRQGDSGEFRMTVVLDEDYNAKHAEAIRKGEDPHLSFRLQVSNMKAQFSDVPLTQTNQFGIDEEQRRLQSGEINHPDGGRIFFSLNSDATGEALSGEIIGCPGGLGRLVLERQH